MKSNFYLLFSILFLLGSVPTFAQIGIGTKTPAASAALEVSSTANNKGILIPRITATQKDAIVSPAEGLLVYQTTAPIGFYYYSNTVWKLIVDQTDLDKKLASAKTYVDDKIAAATIPDADATTKGKIQLAGDLGGTAAAPTVPGLALKANTSNMTTALASKANTSDVTTGLALKANTSDVTTALASKANISSLSTVATSGNYNDLANKPNIPSAYVMPKASASALGGVKVGANLSIDADGVLSAAASNSITGVVPISNGGTSSTSLAGIKSLMGLNSPSVAIGDQTQEGSYTVGVGGGAGATNQGSSSVAVGYVAGYNNQGNASVAIGSNAAQSNQGTQAVALGFAAGQNGQGAYSVAVGSYAGNVQAANSIALNATGASLNPSTTGFYVAPIRNASASNSLFYDSATKEITYGTAAASGGVPYTGATSAVNLGNYDLTVNGLKIGKGVSSKSINTAVGLQALNSDSSSPMIPGNNSAFGYYALRANTDGFSNTAMGYNVLRSNTDGSYNTGVGNSVLSSNTSGIQNAGVGNSTLAGNQTGSYNTAMGTAALQGNTTGANNTATGFRALYKNTSGNNNTAIGYEADVVSNNLSNATAIGYGAAVAASNTIQMGNTSVTDVKTSGTITAGAVTYPNAHGTSGQVLSTTGSGTLAWTTPSASSSSAHYVGESYGGGIVFYVWDNGAHGLIVAPHEIGGEGPQNFSPSAGIKWGPTGTITGAFRFGIGGGLHNTDVILAKNAISGQQYFDYAQITSGLYAAFIAQQYSTYTQGNVLPSSFGDWYLPSMGELKLLYASLGSISGSGYISSHVYWSSTETNADYVYQLSVGGGQNWNHKSTSAYVIPIRMF